MPYPTATGSPTFLPTPTFIQSDLTQGLKVVYISNDALYLWEEGQVKELVVKESIRSPSISDDGEWIRFTHKVQEVHPRSEIWAVRSDGSDIRRLLSTERIASLSEEGELFIDHLTWIPGQHQFLFNTQDVIDGPPGSHRNYDLYLLDLDGNLRQLASPENGGVFFPSPDGRYIALAQPKRISLFDLEAGTNQVLLEFEAMVSPGGFPGAPVLHWDKTGSSITTSISPSYVYYPDQYGGEPEQIWQLHINGQAELLAEVEPIVGWPTAVNLSPTSDYYFYYEAGVCLDGAFRVPHLRKLPSGEEIRQYPCTSYLPEWIQDGESFFYRQDGIWTLGNVKNPSTQQLEFLNLPTAKNISPPLSTHWLNGSLFFLRIHSPEGCNLLLGSPDGLIASVYQSQSRDCLGFDYILPK
jgi:hypothetical protein